MFVISHIHHNLAKVDVFVDNPQCFEMCEEEKIFQLDLRSFAN